MASFIIRDLSISRMPGFPQGMKEFKDLAPNINIISGPNASGKSSTARLLRDMIWQRELNEMQARAIASLGDEQWTINASHGPVRMQCDGSDRKLSDIPDYGASSRYMLAMHDLIQAEEKDLANQIARISIGGYNIDESCRILGYSDTIRGRNIGQYSGYSAADQDYQQFALNQQSLKKEEQELEQLHQQKEESLKAEGQRLLYETLIEFINARELHNASVESFFGFPPVLENIKGGEYTKIEELEKEILTAENNIERARKVITEKKKIIDGLNLPENGISNQDLKNLEEYTRKAEKLEGDVLQKKQQITNAENCAGNALLAVDPEIDTSLWEGLKIGQVNNLNVFLQEAHRLSCQKQFHETSIAELEKITGKDHKDPQVMANGISCLGLWLQEQKPSAAISPNVLLILSGMGIASFLLTIISGWWGLIPVFALLTFTLFVLQRKPIDGSSDIRKADYEKTGLPSPPAWDATTVGQTLSGLTNELRDSLINEKNKQLLASQENQLSEVKQRLGQFTRKHSQWFSELGAVPPLPNDDPASYSGFYWFLVNVSEWQKHFLSAKGLKAELAIIEKELDSFLENINTILTRHNAPEASDVSRAMGSSRQLREDEHNRKDAANEIIRENEKIQDLEKNLKDRKISLGNIYQSLEIEQGQKTEVLRLTQQLRPYREAAAHVQTRGLLREEIHKKLKNHSLYEPQLETLSLDIAIENKHRYEEIAGKRDELTEKIADIEARISTVSGGETLEQTLARKEKALEELRIVHHENLSSITGHLLAEQLKKENREKNSPPVFKHAQALFNRISCGRYELRIDDHNQAFLAYDTVSREGIELSRLSTGTRIQLLMSVRLAYIEKMEGGIKLPVLADELFANSDDIRAGEIIDALVEISRTGRQIFYFTAQGDEVTKWVDNLNKHHDVSLKVIELDGKANGDSLSRPMQQASPAGIILNSGIPYPEGLSHEKFGDVLEVPAYHLIRNTPGQLHLWYLIEDTDLLHACLSRNIKHWGQLESFLHYEGKLHRLDKETQDKLKVRVKLLDGYLNLYRTGRSKYVDRTVIEASGAVSRNYLAAVGQKLEECDGDGKALIEALRNGEVTGFRANKIAELEAYLTDQGYLSQESPLEPEQIATRLNALITNLNLDPREAEDFLRRFGGIAHQGISN